MTTTTAFAAETKISAGTHITNDRKLSLDRDMNYAVKITSSTLMKVLEGTKYGKVLAPLLGGVLDAFIEKSEERIEKKVTELSDKVDRIFEKLDASEASIKAELSNDLGVQSFYDSFVRFKSLTESLNKKIRDIYASNLSDADKLAKIGSLTGSYNEWRNKFEDTLNELNNYCKKPSMTQNGNIFELAYNHYAGTVMFSGEAIDKARPVCSYVLQVYTAGCATLAESLTAQLGYAKLSDDAKKNANPEFSAHLCKEVNDIENEIKTVTKLLTGEENGKKTDTIKGMMDSVMNKPRTILVNKGHDNIELAKEIRVRDHVTKFADGKYQDQKGEKAAQEFNGVFDKSALSTEKAKMIADYARDKNISIRKLLENNGFDVSKLPKDANLVTAKARDDSVTKLSKAIGYNYVKACYKGVGIDRTGAGEADVQLMDCGYNSWKFSEWNYTKPGNACILLIK